jgi:hypothetical protein
MKSLIQIILTFITFLVACLIALANTARAQEADSVIVPDPLFMPEAKALSDLRLWSFDKWLSVRQTNHPQYHYPLGAVRFRAYLHFCKRHQLNVDMHPVETLANRYLVGSISAHFEEPEWGAFKDMNEDQIRAFLTDLGRDIYAYEFAGAIAAMKTTKDASGKTNKAYCEDIANENFQDYVALRATAKRELGR